MKILFWSDYYPPRLGGIEKMARVLAQGLTRRGHKVQVVASREPGEVLPEYSEEGEFPVWRLPLLPSLEENNLTSLAANLRKIAAIKREFQPDIVHMFTHRAGCFFHLRTMAPASSATVVTMHDFSAELRGGQGTLLGKLFDHTAEITFVSKALCEETLGVLPELSQRSTTIHNALSFEKVPLPVWNKDVSKPIFFTAGRLVWEKGFDVLLEAFRAVLDQIPEAKLVVAGAGPEENSLRAQAERLGFMKQVEFPGRLHDHDVLAQMAKADIVVMPSRIETFGLVALEAAQVGKPVVASKTGGLPEVVKDGVTGLLVEPGETQPLIAAMLRLARSPGQCRAMGLAAQAHALKCFNPEDMLDAYEQVYQRAVRAADVNAQKPEAAA